QGVFKVPGIQGVDGTFPVQLAKSAGSDAEWEQPWGLLQQPRVKAGAGRKAMGQLATALPGLANREPGGYAQFVDGFARAWRRGSSYTSSWPSPLFCFWLWLARISKLAPEGLAAPGTRGIATLRVKPEGQDAWSPDLVWRLEGRILDDYLQTFP
ncbi:MAG: hypothetical protein AAGD06_33600, partial [Acidobacteriota bacterium]